MDSSSSINKKKKKRKKKKNKTRRIAQLGATAAKIKIPSTQKALKVKVKSAHFYATYRISYDTLLSKSASKYDQYFEVVGKFSYQKNTKMALKVEEGRTTLNSNHF